MIDDIVTRLREAATSNAGEYQLTMAPELCLAIADEIERLKKQIQVGNKLFILVKSNYTCLCRRQWICYKCQILKEWEELN